MRYPDYLVGWLADVCESIEYRWSPVQILEMEALYPGLIDDLAVEVWQRRLVHSQLEDSKTEQEDSDDGEP